MTAITARIRAVLTSFVTWLVSAGAVVAIVLAELEPFRDVPRLGTILNVASVVATVLAVVVNVISRVTKVLPAAQGLLPPPDYVAWTAREEALRG